MSESDDLIRSAAFTHCHRLLRDHGGAVPWSAITQGLEVNGECVVLSGQARGIHKRGIHKPRQVEDWPDRDLPAARFVAFRAGP
jgi:hypothetical protein